MTMLVQYIVCIALLIGRVRNQDGFVDFSQTDPSPPGGQKIDKDPVPKPPNTSGGFLLPAGDPDNQKGNQEILFDPKKPENKGQLDPNTMDKKLGQRQKPTGQGLDKPSDPVKPENREQKPVSTGNNFMDGKPNFLSPKKDETQQKPNTEQKPTDSKPPKTDNKPSKPEDKVKDKSLRTAGDGPEVPLDVLEEQEQALIKQVCESSGCSDVRPLLCYQPHPLDCKKFINCKLHAGVGYSGVAMPCAFGTFWQTSGEKACNRADLVDCVNDPCKEKGRKVYPHPGKNCRTFWECKGGKSYPTCCPRYQRFSAVSNRCVDDLSCTHLCPIIKNETCAGRGVRYIDYPDDNCKTIWDCESGKPHPICCDDGYGFDHVQEKCVKSSTCNDTCTFPKEVCNFDPVPGDPQKYFHKIANVIMSCAEGTIFKDCQCQDNRKQIMKTKPKAKGCVPAIYIQPPNLKNQGGVVAAILLVRGSFGTGSTFNSTTTGFFQGNTDLEIPYYGGQAPWNIYLDVTFKNRYERPSSPPYFQQVLITSCKDASDGMPTFEVTLNPPVEGKSRLILRIAGSPPMEVHDFVHMNEWTRLLILYDGFKLLTEVEALDRPEIPVSTQFNKISGTVPMSRRGMRLGFCPGAPMKQSFVGDIYEFKFAKCVTPEQKKLLYPTDA